MHWKKNLYHVTLVLKKNRVTLFLKKHRKTLYCIELVIAVAVLLSVYVLLLSVFNQLVPEQRENMVNGIVGVAMVMGLVTGLFVFVVHFGSENEADLAKASTE